MAKIFRLLAGCLPVLISTWVSAQVVVYDNFTTDLNRYLDERTIESGDQITLAPGSQRQIANFTFEYYIDPAAYTGTETARVRFYDLTGTPLADSTPTPGQVLYDSQPFTLTFGGKVRVTLPEVGVTVPDSFVWTVELGGGTIGVDRSPNPGIAGLSFYSSPTVGSSDYPYDFWQKIGGVWDVYNFDGDIVDFGAKLTAVPEPWATPVVFLGCAALFAWRRRVRLAKS